MTTFIYVLNLYHNRFYLGITTDTSDFKQILRNIPNNLRRWIDTYGIINLELINEFHSNSSNIQDILDNTVRLYMLYNKVDNVRGGIYNLTHIAKHEKRDIEDRLKNVNQFTMIEKIGEFFQHRYELIELRKGDFMYFKRRQPLHERVAAPRVILPREMTGEERRNNSIVDFLEK